MHGGVVPGYAVTQSERGALKKRRQRPPALPCSAVESFRETSDRTFGLVAGAALVILELVRYLRGRDLQSWVIVLAGLLVLLAAVRPRLLRGPKRGWLFLGLLLGRVVNPIVLAVLFFAVITPAGWLMRFFGGDPMRIRNTEDVSTYWIQRTEPASNMQDQF
jgi:hypothetical protein